MMQIKNGFLGSKFFLLSIVATIMMSCGAMYYTKYENKEIQIGESKESILRKFGRPYSEDLLYEDGKLTEILCYKESMPYGYTLNTYFFFQNNTLIKKTQRDNSPSEVILKETD